MSFALTVREEAEQLLARYAEHVDAGDFDGIAELLAGADVALADGTVIASGRDQIRSLYAGMNRVYPDGTLRSHHVITNVIVDPIDDGRVRLRARFTVFQATDDLPLQPIVAGRYDDVIEQRSGRWEIAVHTMIPTLWGDVHAHLTVDPRQIP